MVNIFCKWCSTYPSLALWWIQKITISNYMQNNASPSNKSQFGQVAGQWLLLPWCLFGKECATAKKSLHHFGHQTSELKGVSENRRNVKRKFSIVRIGRFCRFQRYQTGKICEISWVIIKNLWNEYSGCQLSQNSNAEWNFC